MDVSENNGTPKSSILIGFSIINHPFWGNPIFGNTHIDKEIVYTLRYLYQKPRASWNLWSICISPKRPPVFWGTSQAGTLRHDHCRGTWSGGLQFKIYQKWSTVKEILGPKNDLNSSGWNMIIDMISWFLNMLFDLPRHMVEKPEKQLLQTHWPVLIFQVKNGAALSGSIDARRGVRYSTAVDFPSSV